MKTKANHARKFNSIMPYINHEWAAKVLGMQVNPHQGPDLIDEKKLIEIKFTLISEGKYPIAWTVLEHQMNYPQKYQKPGFWGLGKYWLKIPVEEINTKNPEELEELVEKRELFIVDWKWMFQFQPSPTNGETEFSKWNNILRYPRACLLPEISKTYESEKGLVHLTKKVKSDYFRFLRDKIPF